MTLEIQRDAPLFEVHLNRPQRKNAVDRSTASELADAFREFDRDESFRVGLLHGRHGTFSAGADLQEISSGRMNRLEPEGDAPMGPTRMRLSKPTVASISGHAVAGGLELALWCDLRVASVDALFGVYCRKWGIPLIDGGTVRLPRIIGEGHALDMILTGRTVKADEAQKMGLVNRIVPEGDVLAKARSLGEKLADFPQECMRHDRASLYEQADLSMEEAMENEFEHGMKSLEDADLPARLRSEFDGKDH